MHWREEPNRLRLYEPVGRIKKPRPAVLSFRYLSPRPRLLPSLLLHPAAGGNTSVGVHRKKWVYKTFGCASISEYKTRVGKPKLNSSFLEKKTLRWIY
ncbi:MAG: hypothetical protein JW945_04600, partial [Methanomicrobia archaeon]|nr:hypothetical protein [Methanomicrobia archaeon]